MTRLEEFLTRAYLNGELDGEAAEAFELLLIQRPDIAEVVDADTALQMGLAAALKQPAAGPEVQKATEVSAESTPPAPGRPGPKVVDIQSAPLAGRRRPFLFSPALAAGLALVMGVGVGAGYLVRKPAVAGMEMATLAYVDKTRAISAVPVIRLPAKGAVVLLAPVAVVDACVPEVSLLQESRAPLRAFAQADEFGYVSLVVAREALGLGKAKLEVRCGAAAPASYPVDFQAVAD